MCPVKSAHQMHFRISLEIVAHLGAFCLLSYDCYEFVHRLLKINVTKKGILQ